MRVNRSACETGCILSQAVRYLSWSKLRFLCTFISFYSHVKATRWRWLQRENQQPCGTAHYQKQRKRKTSKARELWRRVPPSPQRAIALSKVRIIDLDREESSNWNEMCLNNSLNVSFLAFQITCTVKPDFFLLAGSQRTFCVQSASERRRKKKKTTCEFASFWMTLGPGF